MTSESAAALPIAEPPSASTPDRRTESAPLRRRWLLLARTIWAAALVLALGLLIVSIPLRAGILLSLCGPGRCQPGQLTAPELQALQQLGLSLGFYVTYNVALSTLFVLVFCVVAVIIFLRKSDDWIGIYASLVLLIFPMSLSNELEVLRISYPAFAPLALSLNSLGGAMFGIFLYLFPDGRFMPRWTRWLVPLVVAREFADPYLSVSGIQAVAFLAEVATVVFAQIYRYRRVSNITQRQQTKWFVYGTVIAVLGFTSVLLLDSIIWTEGDPGSALPNLIVLTAVYFFLLLLPLSLLMAILRSRLWDIDILINRTLVYVPLTAILAGLFSASVVVLQRAFIAVSGQQSDAASVLSTLVIVAAFTPIKDRLQTLVDKRFKGAPESIRRLNAFGEQVRTRVSEVSAYQITRRLLEEVVAAFEAEGGAAFWGASGQMELIHTAGEWHGEAQLSESLLDDDRQLGVLSLGARRKGHDYSEQDRAALHQVAQTVAVAIVQDSRTKTRVVR